MSSLDQHQPSVSDVIRRTLTIALIAFITLSIVLVFASLPVPVAAMFVPFQVSEPSDLPFEIEQKKTDVSLGQRVSITYSAKDGQELTLHVTNKLGWHNVRSWEEVKLTDGTIAYFTKWEDTNVLSWQKGDVEYGLDYRGDLLQLEDLVKVAESIQ